LASSPKAFGLGPGDRLAGKYVVVEHVGSGWEGEVYLVRERSTGIERSVKLFYPQRNPGNRTVRRYARKLHKLRGCSILVPYHNQETVRVGDRSVTLLVSDFVEGEPLATFLRRQPGKRLDFFQGLHLLHDLAAGVEPIHARGEYHGDLHDENIIIRRQGLGFEIKLLDMFSRDMPRGAAIRGDVHDMIRILYDALGGKRTYAGHPPEIRAVCCGLKRTLIDRKFRTAGQLRAYLTRLEWVTR
jgi:tRNA A-37 threonylcarbamoyl transferase component Bud32